MGAEYVLQSWKPKLVVPYISFHGRPIRIKNAPRSPSLTLSSCNARLLAKID